MMRIRAVSISLALLIGCTALAAGYAEVGAFFGLGGSARALGMGSAFAAIADDEGAVLYNPAALGNYEGFGATSLFMKQFGGLTYGAVTLATSNVGATVLLLDSGAIASGSSAFRYASQGFVLGAGLPVGPIGLGVRWRALNVSAPVDGFGWSLDPCLLFLTPSLRLSAMVEGALSSPMHYDSGSDEPFSRALSLGAAATLAPDEDIQWNLAFQVDGILTAAMRLAIGLETWIYGLGARLGYDGVGMTFGLSAKLANVQVDWAYAMRNDLGDSHRVGLSLRW